MLVVNDVLVLPGRGEPLRRERRELPDLGVHEALVRVEACGVCGSDLFLQKGGFGLDKFPVVPGHEAAGRVEAVGSPEDVAWIGRQVALYYIDAPRESRWARSGAINIGPAITRMGVDVDGAFARYVIRPVRTLIPVEPELDPAVVAVCTDALATPYHALTAIANVQPGEHVVVIGPGGIGSNAVQIARLLGATVTVVGRSVGKLEQARTLGARACVQSEAGVDAVIAAAGENIDVVLECSGSLDMARFAVECAGYRARVVMIGASREHFSMSTGELIWRELAVMGSRGFTPREITEVLTHVRDGRLTTEHVTGDRRPWQEANAALDDLRLGRSTRTVLVMDDAQWV
jgi:D-arabinose 1-dehydrogenase-like Zn-dependent alcohol dehydrogenase